MLAGLLAASRPPVSGDATTDQVAQEAYAFGETTIAGTVASTQAAQSSSGAGTVPLVGTVVTTQDVQVTIADAEGGLVVGSADTDQSRRQKTKARGLGPPPQTPRPMRSSRGTSSPRRPIVITIRSGG